MARVLVTGATGFIGSSVVARLEAAKHVVIRGQRSPVKKNGVILDLEKVETLEKLAREEPCEAIIHLGTKVGWSGESDDDLYAPNVLATEMLAGVARDWDAYFVFTSAALVHGIKTRLITPNSPISPDTPYTRSKWLAEERISTVNPKHCVIRLGGVFGLDGPQHLGLNRAIKQCLEGNKPRYTGEGKALRNYIYVEDVAAVVCHLLDRQTHGVHLLGGLETLSIRDMLGMLTDTFLPGQRPDRLPGEDANDQVIQVSPELLPAHPYRVNLADMANKADCRAS